MVDFTDIKMALKLTTLFCFLAAFEIRFIHGFRTDYTYINSTRSYYKYHREIATWAVANSTCQSEGGWLFHPDSVEELELVISVLEVGPNDDYGTHIGMSDLEEFMVYKTVDGRPISEVYDKWRPGEPYPGSNNEHRCGGIVVASRELYVYLCYLSRRYICKHQPLDYVDAEIYRDKPLTITAIDEIKTVIGTVSNKLTGALERLAASQTSAIDKLAQSIDRQNKEIQRQATDQSATLNPIAEAGVNQAADFERQNEEMKRQAASLTAALQRLALALEKLASWQDDNEELGGWLQDRGES